MEIDIDKIIDGYYESDIHQYYQKYGKKAEGYALQKMYAKTKTGKAKLLAAAKLGTEKAAKLPTSKSKLQGAINGGKKIGGSVEGKKRMSELGKKWAGIYGFNQMTKEEQKEIGRKYGKQNLVGEIICEKCGRTTNKGNYRFHGNNCRESDKLRLINTLPDLFTKQIVKETAIKLNIDDWIKLNILHPTCPYTEIHIKVEKPNQFNPCWYKKTI